MNLFNPRNLLTVTTMTPAYRTVITPRTVNVSVTATCSARF
jgi:hypothetical protein